jgi:hypothetical protein
LRTPPVKHTVHRHIRQGKPVQSYRRGSRTLRNPLTKKLIPLKIKHLPIDPIQRTPSGRPTDALVKVAKDQTLVWESDGGSMRIVLGHYRPRMKSRSCEVCGHYFEEGEPIVMAQDYFPFRGYFPTYSAYHVRHFPFKMDNLVQAEKDINKYMTTVKKEPSIFHEGKFTEKENDIYTLEEDARRGLIKKD